MNMTNYGFGPWNRFPLILGPKIAFYWELLYKKLPIGGVVYMALYGIESRRLYP